MWRPYFFLIPPSFSAAFRQANALDVFMESIEAKAAEPNEDLSKKAWILVIWSQWGQSSRLNKGRSFQHQGLNQT